MREILFRGKRKDNGEWVEGYYVCVGGKFHYILTGQIDLMSGYPRFFYCEVIPETVGQCTGLIDKNGKKIFEGDIVMIQYGASMILFYEVVYQNDWARFALKSFGKIRMCDAINERIAKRCEVVGNVHDNPELMK